MLFRSNDTATTEIYTRLYTLSLHDALPISPRPEKLVVDFDTTVNSSPTDISGKGNHGAFYNGASYSAADKAFTFDGTDDYIDIPSVSGVGTGAWVHSKSFWFKLHSSTDAGILFLLGSNGSTRQIAVQSNGSGQFQYFIYGCNSRVQVNGSDWFPDVNRWYHCVTVFKNNETTATGGVLTGREMYIDGVKQTLVAIGTQIALDLNTTGVRFGNQYNSAYLDYELSNPKLYNVTLEPSEVKKLYNLGRTGRSMVISDTAVGIGKVPEAQLDVRGNINSAGIMTNQNYMFWATGPSTANTQNEFGTSNDVLADFSRIEFELGSGFDTSTKTYTIPCSGYWEFEYCILARNRAVGNHYVMGRWLVNGAVYDRRTFVYFVGQGGGAQESDLVGKMLGYWPTGTTVAVRITQNTGATDAYMEQTYSNFYGKLLH